MTKPSLATEPLGDVTGLPRSVVESNHRKARRLLRGCQEILDDARQVADDHSYFMGRKLDLIARTIDLAIGDEPLEEDDLRVLYAQLGNMAPVRTAGEAVFGTAVYLLFRCVHGIVVNTNDYHTEHGAVWDYRHREVEDIRHMLTGYGMLPLEHR